MTFFKQIAIFANPGAHKKKEMDWAHPGRRFTTKNSYRRKMTLYLMVAVVYGKPKDEAQQRKEWRVWRLSPAEPA